MVRRPGKWIIPVTLALALFFMSAFSVLPAAGEEVVEGEEPTFSQLHEELEEFLTLMGQGEADGALEALTRYLQDLKELSEAEGLLAEEEMHIAHVLYVTSKHLAVLARVYEKIPEVARKGVGNALMRSVKGHEHFYTLLEGAASGEVTEEEADREAFEESEQGGENPGGHGNSGSRSGRGRKKK